MMPEGNIQVVMTTAPAGEVFASHLHLVLPQVQQCHRALNAARQEMGRVDGPVFGGGKWKMVGKYGCFYGLMIKDSRKMVGKMIAPSFLQRSFMVFVYAYGWLVLQTCLSQPFP